MNRLAGAVAQEDDLDLEKERDEMDDQVVEEMQDHEKEYLLKREARSLGERARQDALKRVTKRRGD